MNLLELTEQKSNEPNDYFIKEMGIRTPLNDMLRQLNILKRTKDNKEKLVGFMEKKSSSRSNVFNPLHLSVATPGEFSQLPLAIKTNLLVLPISVSTCEEKLGNPLDQLQGMINYLGNVNNRPIMTKYSEDKRNLWKIEVPSDNIEYLSRYAPFSVSIKELYETYDLATELKSTGFELGANELSCTGSFMNIIKCNTLVKFFPGTSLSRKVVESDARALVIKRGIKFFFCNYTVTAGATTGMSMNLVNGVYFREISREHMIDNLTILHEIMSGYKIENIKDEENKKDWTFVIDHYEFSINEEYLERLKLVKRHIDSNYSDNKKDHYCDITFDIYEEKKIVKLSYGPGVLLRKDEIGGRVVVSDSCSVMQYPPETTLYNTTAEQFLHIPYIRFSLGPRGKLGSDFNTSAIAPGNHSVNAQFEYDIPCTYTKRTLELIKLGGGKRLGNINVFLAHIDGKELVEDGIIVNERWANKRLTIKESIKVYGNRKAYPIGTVLTKKNCNLWKYNVPGKVIDLRIPKSGSHTLTMITERNTTLLEGWKLCTVSGNKGVIKLKKESELPVIFKERNIKGVMTKVFSRVPDIIIGSTTFLSRCVIPEIYTMYNKGLDTGELLGTGYKMTQQNQLVMQKISIGIKGTNTKRDVTTVVEVNAGYVPILINVNTPDIFQSTSLRVPTNEFSGSSRGDGKVGEMERTQLAGNGHIDTLNELSMKSNAVIAPICSQCFHLEGCQCQTPGNTTNIITTTAAIKIAKTEYCLTGQSTVVDCDNRIYSENILAYKTNNIKRQLSFLNPSNSLTKPTYDKVLRMIDEGYTIEQIATELLHQINMAESAVMPSV